MKLIINSPRMAYFTVELLNEFNRMKPGISARKAQRIVPVDIGYLPGEGEIAAQLRHNGGTLKVSLDHLNQYEVCFAVRNERIELRFANERDFVFLLLQFK